ncbi:hypothetical protein ACFPN4_13400 [Ureibacillus thermophilus]|uniref:hypothetical protein n=1 Tax=Ureibacillus thermophilus TaxID=367743 RepID=UPI003623D4D0
MQKQEQLKLAQGSLNFSSFIHSFAQFLITYFERHQMKDIPKEELLKCEMQVTQSLLLIEKMHMLLYLYFSTLRSYYSSEEITPFNNGEILEVFMQMKNLIIQHPFQLEEHRIISEKTITQILSYYIAETTQEISHKDELTIVTFTSSPLPPPWLAHQL